jgi:6,7-dimethyl-8-ribityllumazine synthase
VDAIIPVGILINPPQSSALPQLPPPRSPRGTPPLYTPPYTPFSPMLPLPLSSGGRDHPSRHSDQGRHDPFPFPIPSWVPRGYGTPLLYKPALASSPHPCSHRQVDAIIPVGILIKGDTYHFEAISDSVASGLMSVGLQTGIPVSFGVLTCMTEEQAKARRMGRGRGRRNGKWAGGHAEKGVNRVRKGQRLSVGSTREHLGPAQGEESGGCGV